MNEYIWLIWSLILVVIWLAVYFSLTREAKREMLRVSLWTALLGFTEPFFVPRYWAPPSLFNLALRTGFDLESFIFSFGIGGLAVVLYELVFKTHHSAMTEKEQHANRHRWHLLTLLSASAVFAVLEIWTGLNPIYSAIIALLAGGLAASFCRPDLKDKMVGSAFIFLLLYFLYFLVLNALAPGYVERVWNLPAISGILILGIPLEELLFALTFGFLWSGIYEHFAWRKIKIQTT